MHCTVAILSSLACPALQYFPHYLKIVEKELSKVKYVSTFYLQLLPETLIILEELVINVNRSSCKGHVNLSDFNAS